MESMMIKSFKHKGLQKVFENDAPSGVQAKDVKRIKLRLLMLDETTSAENFRAYPGFKFHPLKGDKRIFMRAMFGRTGESHLSLSVVTPTINSTCTRIYSLRIAFHRAGITITANQILQIGRPHRQHPVAQPFYPGRLQQ